MKRWLDRSLFVSPYYYCLCLTEKAFRKELKRLELPKKEWPPFILNDHSDATAHTFQKGDGSLAAIICLRATSKNSLAQIHSLLVHEAVHLWQSIRENIGEREPSVEFEAYSIQTLSQRLFESYADQTKGKQ